MTEASRGTPHGWAGLGDLAYLAYPLVPLAWLRAAARLAGGVAGLVRTRAWRTARDNMRTVLEPVAPALDHGALARRFLVNQRLQNLTVTLAPRLRTEDLARQLPIEGLEHLEAALAGGTGAVLLASHLNSTSLFVAAVVLRRRGYDVSVALPIPGDPWGRSRLRRAADRWLGVAPLKDQMGGFYAQFNVRPIMARLRHGGAVVMTGDGWHAAAFVEAAFLGRRLPFPTGAFSVARAARAPLVPVFGLGEPATGVRFTIGEPLPAFATGRPDTDVEAAIAAYARQLEARLLAHPAAWQYWEETALLGSLAALPSRSLEDRYRM